MHTFIIRASTIPDAWYQALRLIRDCGREYIIDRGSFKGSKRKEIDSVVVHIKKPYLEPYTEMLPIIPENMNIPNPTSEKYISQYVRYIMTPELEPNEQYTYGSRIHDQIFKVIEMFKREGHNTNQAVLQIAQPSDIDLDDPPCFRHIHLKIIDGKLHSFLVARSWDAWSGMPSNLPAFAILQKFIAEQVGVEIGEMVVFCSGLHVYDFNYEYMNIRLGGV